MSSYSPVMASVIVALIGDFPRRPIVEQDKLKTAVEDLVVRVIRTLPVEGRIVLDAAHGIAVALLDSQSLALDVAIQIQREGRDLPLQVGINYGPISAFDDGSRGRGLAGDGLAAAMILAEAASPNRLIASKTFRDALASDFPASAARLVSNGAHTDSQIRTHELYTLDPKAARARRLRLAFVGAIAFAVILGLGLAARMFIETQSAPAVIELQITPRGEIYVDGVLKGESPPLSRLDVTPGPHIIEVRNDEHPPLHVEINPKRAEQVTIAHAFPIKPAKPTKPMKRATKKHNEPGMGDKIREGWRSFRRSAGF